MNGEVGANAVKNPTYAVIECTKERIHVIVYQVTGNKTSEEVNGTQMPVFPGGGGGGGEGNRTVIYECEILQSDRADRTTR